MHVCTEHSGFVRVIRAVPPCPALPSGGFATGCLDKAVRLYAVDVSSSGAVRVELKGELSGHTMGVISLGFTSAGDLISGGWEGQAR